MADYNRVLIMGRLTRDTELRYTPSGTAVADFNVAVNRNFTTADGVQKRETCFVDVTAWRQLAEQCKDRLKSGSNVFVDGRLHLDTWNGPDGEKRNKLRVVAENVMFLDKPSEVPQAMAMAPEKYEF
ncbi:MAG: single-stranded DNA-binding protein [Planctomycetota bacterium]